MPTHSRCQGGPSTGFEVTSIVRDIKIAELVPVDEGTASLLGMQPGITAIRLMRVFSVKGSTLSLDDAYYDARRYPGFLDQVTTQTSTYALLRDGYGVQFGSADRYLRSPIWHR